MKKNWWRARCFHNDEGGRHLGFHWEKSVKDHFNKKLSYQNNWAIKVEVNVKETYIACLMSVTISDRSLWPEGCLTVSDHLDRSSGNVGSRNSFLEEVSSAVFLGILHFRCYSVEAEWLLSTVACKKKKNTQKLKTNKSSNNNKSRSSLTSDGCFWKLLKMAVIPVLRSDYQTMPAMCRRCDPQAEMLLVASGLNLLSQASSINSGVIFK